MIHSVEKRKKRVKGILKTARLFSLRYRIGDMPCDKWVSLGVTDKGVARSKAEQFIKDVEREQAGLALPKKQASSANLPMVGLVAEYVSELHARGRDSKYVTSTGKRLASVSVECKWVKLGDVSGESFMSWRRIQKLRGKTLNDYLCDVRAFLQWLVELDRLPVNPFGKNVPRVSCDGEEPEVRRAFPTAEFDRLCAVSGPRTLIYQLTLFCGLRRNEVSQLVWGDVLTSREGDTFLKLRKSTTKNGKVVSQPVPVWLAKSLEKHRPAACKLSDKVFQCIPRMPRFLKDLDAAKIPRVDERGHVSVFHSLRHTFGTWLWATGSDPRVIMKLMRHSDLNLTVKRYTDEACLASTNAVMKLPDFSELVGECTQIGAQISAAEGQILSQGGGQKEKITLSKVVGNESFSRPLALPVAVGRMVHAAGFEPATPSV